jgi:5,10-methylenetetrahydromethanopterin reductase
MPRPVRFGIAIVASEPPEDFIQTVRLAEELGFDSIWVPDYRLYRDVYVSLTLAALNTTHVRLGCAVTNPYTRHPALTAVGIASVDALSGGRAVLGLGAGGVVLDRLQVKRHHPVLACRSAVENIRRYLGGNPVRGVGKPTTTNSNVHLDFPARADLPIFVAATGRKMLTVAGEIADGVIVNVGAHEACVEAALAAVGNGAWGVKRPRQGLELLCWLQGCAVSDDRTEALKAVKPTAALTLGHAPGWMLEAMEIDESDAREIRKVYYTEGARVAAELVTDEMAEKYTIAGTPERAVGKIKRLRAQGFDEIIFLPDETGGTIREAMRTLVDRVITPL